MSKLYLKNANYIDWQTFEIKKVNIEVEEGINGKINFVSEIPDNAQNVLDVSGKYVTKAFVVGHHHIYSALAVGMPAPKKNPTNFYEILKYVWWTLDKSLTKEMIELSALTTAIYAAKAGVSFIIDHHASPFAIEGSLYTIANALENVGLGYLLCYEISDRDGKEIAKKGLEETENFLKNNQNGLVGLHASFTISEDTMKAAADLVEKYNSGVHIHVAEDRFDQDLTIYQVGKRVIERLNDYGLLDSPKTILAHAIHINENERQILANSKAWIVQNPESNLNNQVGYFVSTGLNKNRVMLGTDGMHSDMIRTAQVAYFVGKNYEQLDFAEVYSRLRNNHKYLSENGFLGDGENNLVVLDYKPRTELTKDNFLGHFFFGLSSADVVHLISQGRLIVKDRKVLTIDEEVIFKEAQKLSKILWQKMSEINY